MASSSKQLLHLEQFEAGLDILHLYKDYYPILGGMENHIKMLAEAQAAAGHSVRVLVTNPGGLPRRETIAGVSVERVPRLATVASTPLSFSFIPRLARSQVDIIHLHYPYPVGEISQHIAGRGRPYVISYQSDVVRTSQQLPLRFYRPLMRRILAHARRILVTSQAYVRTSETLQPFADKCVLAPLGIDPQPFLAAEPLLPRPANGQITALFVGRHRYYKGLDYLIRALPDTDVRLLVGGDGPMRPAWQALVHQLNLGERVQFLGDIPEPDLPRLYASADLFVLPSHLRAEAFGTVLLEAMAAGLPCITTELGTGTSFVVKHEQTGLVVSPAQPSVLAAAVNQLAADPGMRQRMGAAGRKRVLEEFTIDHMFQRVQAIYQEVLAEEK